MATELPVTQRKCTEVYSIATMNQRIQISLERGVLSALAFGGDQSLRVVFHAMAPIADCRVNTEVGTLTVGTVWIDISPESAERLAQDYGLRIFNIDD